MLLVIQYSQKFITQREEKQLLEEKSRYYLVKDQSSRKPAKINKPTPTPPKFNLSFQISLNKLFPAAKEQQNLLFK